MPLKTGSSKAVISANIAELIPSLKEKRPDATEKEIRDQAVAIAMRKAGIPKKKASAATYESRQEKIERTKKEMNKRFSLKKVNPKRKAAMKKYLEKELIAKFGSIDNARLYYNLGIGQTVFVMTAQGKTPATVVNINRVLGQATLKRLDNNAELIMPIESLNFSREKYKLDTPKFVVSLLNDWTGISIGTFVKLQRKGIVKELDPTTFLVGEKKIVAKGSNPKGLDKNRWVVKFSAEIYQDVSKLTRKISGKSPRDWNNSDKKKALQFFKKLSIRELRKRQDIVKQQQGTAFKKRNIDASEDLAVIDDLLLEAVHDLKFGKGK